MQYQHRRSFLARLGQAGLLFAAPGLFAEQLQITPRQTEGPFYPDHLPLDTDNDLLVVNDRITPALGTIAWVSGRVLSPSGEPLRNVTVEIWQCDNNGAYLHQGTTNKEKRDSNFQGFGRFVTGSTGEYLFRTIRPVPYPGRTPHIHFALKRKGRKEFVSQLYIKGDPRNAPDQIYRTLDAKQRPLLETPFTPIPSSKIGEVAARWDIVVGLTPES